MAIASEPKYEERVVAFLDILGFRAKVFQSRETARTVISAIDEAISHALDILSSEGPRSLSIRLFSDCFFLSCCPSDLSLLVRELSFLELLLCASDIFVRGGVSTGYHFESDRIIFSEGLIRAYDLQVKDKYPRITLDDTLVKRMTHETCAYYGDGLVEYLIAGRDEVYFLDYLQILAQEHFDSILEDFFEAHGKAISDGARAGAGNLEVTEKYKWLAEYHNSKFYRFFHADDYCPEAWRETCERMLVPDDIFGLPRLELHGFTKINDELHEEEKGTF